VSWSTSPSDESLSEKAKSRPGAGTRSGGAFTRVLTAVPDGGAGGGAFTRVLTAVPDGGAGGGAFTRILTAVRDRLGAAITGSTVTKFCRTG